jgi:hypothetical protein
VIKRGKKPSGSIFTLTWGSPPPNTETWLAPRGSLKLDARVQMPRRGGVARARANVPMRVHHARVLPAHGDSLPPARALIQLLGQAHDQPERITGSKFLALRFQALSGLGLAAGLALAPWLARLGAVGIGPIQGP